MEEGIVRTGAVSLVQQRRRWSVAEKIRIVQETFEAGATVKSVALRYGVAPNQLFTWRRRVTQDVLPAPGSNGVTVPVADYRALEGQVRELQRLLGKKTLEAEVLKEVLERAMGANRQVRSLTEPDE